MPIFSIIIPVYNVYKYLSDCLESIFNQDLDKSFYEVIVVDDSSPHGEKEIVDSYIKKCSNIKYIRHDINKRQGGARNTGIHIAQGEYIMFMDSDDIIVYNNTFSILKELVEKYDPVILRSESFQSIPTETKYVELNKIFTDVDCIQNTTYNFRQWRSGKISCAVWGTLYKREFLLNNNLFFRENVVFEDTDWSQKALFYAQDIDFIQFPFYGYRQSNDSTTRGYSIQSFEGNAKGVIETYFFYEQVIDRNNSFWEILHESFVDNIIGLLKTSRNYPIPASLEIFNKLKKSGITSIKSKYIKKNIIRFLVHQIPVLPIFAVKILAPLKNLIK